MQKNYATSNLGSSSEPHRLNTKFSQISNVNGYSYLRLIGNYYYIRARLPKRLGFKSKEICFSLKTQDIREAHIAALLFKQVLGYPARLTPEVIKRVTLRMFDIERRRIKSQLDISLIEELLSEKYPSGLDGAAIERHSAGNIRETDVYSDEHYSSLSSQLKSQLAAEKIQYNECQLRQYVDRALLCESMVDELIEAEAGGNRRRKIELLKELPALEQQYFQSKETQQTAIKHQVSLPKFSELAKIFIETGKNVKTKKVFSDNRKKQLKETFTEFMFFIGDKAVDMYTKADIEHFLELLQTTPKYRNKHHKNKTIEQLMALKPTPTQSIKDEVIHKHLQRVGQFFNWVIEESKGRFNDEDMKLLSPCKDVFVAIEQRANSKAKYTDEDLFAIYNPELIMNYDYEYQYWMPLINRAMGTRPEEIAQATLGDWVFEKSSSVWLLKINDDGDKNIKNHSSKRVLPVPQILIDKGFGLYLKQQKATRKAEERLFNELYKQDSYYSTIYQKWYKSEVMIGRGIPKQDIHGNNKSLYSLRHNFITQARKAHLDWIDIKHYAGHSVSKELQITDRYWHTDDFMHIKLMFDDIKYPELLQVPNYEDWEKCRSNRLANGEKKKAITGIVPNEIKQQVLNLDGAF